MILKIVRNGFVWVLRKKIIDMSYTEWKNMGFSKGTLNYMKENAKADKPFTLNAHVRERLKNWIIGFSN